MDLSGYNPSLNYEDLYSQLDSGEVQRKLEDIRIFYQYKDKKEVVEELNLLIKSDSSCIPCFYYRAYSHLNLKNYSASVKDLQKILSFEENEFTGPSYLVLGLIFTFEIRNDFLAKKHLDSALQYLPNNPSVLYSLGIYYYRLDKIGMAIRFLKQSIEANPNQTFPYYLLIDIWQSKRNFELAHKVVNQLLHHFSDDEKGLLMKAKLYFLSSQYEFGIETAKYCLRVHEESLAASSLLSEHYFSKGNNQLGFDYLIRSLRRVDFDKISSSDSSNSRFQYWNALFEISRNQSIYPKELSEECYDIVGWYNTGERMRAMEKLKKQEKKYDSIALGPLMLRAAFAQHFKYRYYWKKDNIEILERNPKAYYSVVSLGDYHVSLGNYHKIQKDELRYNLHLDSAENYYSEALNMNRNKPFLYLLRARLRTNRENYIGALQDWNIYLNINKEDNNAYDSRADIYRKLGYSDQAFIDYQYSFEHRRAYVDINSFSNMISITLAKDDTVTALDLIDQAISKIERSRYGSKSYYSLGLKKEEALNLRGVICMNSGKYEEALESFNKSIAINPKYGLPKLNKGKLIMDQGRYEQALGLFKEYIDLHPYDALGYYWAGKSAHHMNDVFSAKKYLKNAEKMGLPEARSLLSKIQG